jgi:RHS repeat-associated protein
MVFTVLFYNFDLPMLTTSKYTPFTTLSTAIGYFCNSKSGYSFRFNGQEQDNEVAGTGNIMTAEFWMYDGRLGRRWNLDPVDHIISLYSCFGNSPIMFSDPNGDDWIVEKQENDGKTNYKITLNATIINKSGSNIDMSKLRENIISDIKSALAENNLEEAKNLSVDIVVNLRTVNNESEIKQNEHVIAIYGDKEFQKITNTKGGVRGVAHIGGMGVAVPLSTANSIIKSENHRTIPHELLIHSMGMMHPDEDDGILDAGLVNQFDKNHNDNLAWGSEKNRSTTLGTKITGKQLEKMHKNYINNEINRQTQFAHEWIWIQMPNLYPLYFPLYIRTNELNKKF